MCLWYDGDQVDFGCSDRVKYVMCCVSYFLCVLRMHIIVLASIVTVVRYGMLVIDL